jgi:hypothetical protein
MTGLKSHCLHDFFVLIHAIGAVESGRLLRWHTLRPLKKTAFPFAVAKSAARFG